MMKSRLAGLGLATLLIAALSVAATADGTGHPKKVFICHFPGHEAGDVFWNAPGLDDAPILGGVDLDGDFVINWNDAMLYGSPVSYQQEFCATAAANRSANPRYYPGNTAVGGEVLLISVKATKGHRVQKEFRISEYLNGYKG